MRNSFNALTDWRASRRTPSAARRQRFRQTNIRIALVRLRPAATQKGKWSALAEQAAEHRADTKPTPNAAPMSLNDFARPSARHVRDGANAAECSPRSRRKSRGRRRSERRRKRHQHVIKARPRRLSARWVACRSDRRASRMATRRTGLPPMRCRRPRSSLAARAVSPLRNASMSFGSTDDHPEREYVEQHQKSG